MPGVGALNGMPLTVSLVTQELEPGLGYSRAVIAVLAHWPGPGPPAICISPKNMSGNESSVLVPEPEIVTGAQFM